MCRQMWGTVGPDGMKGASPDKRKAAQHIPDMLRKGSTTTTWDKRESQMEKLEVRKSTYAVCSNTTCNTNINICEFGVGLAYVGDLLYNANFLRS